MRIRRILFTDDKYDLFNWSLALLSIMLLVLAFSMNAQSQSPEPVMLHKILIDGHTAQGAYTKVNGTIQTVTCPEPHQWATPDRTEHGWACYEATTQVWVMNAMPPAPVQVVNSAPVTVTPTVIQYPSQVIYLPEYRPVIPGVGEVIYAPTGYPQLVIVRSSRVVIARDAIRETGRVLSSVRVRRGRR